MIKWPWTQEDVDKATKPEPKTIKGWELLVRFKDNTTQSFSHPEYRGLFKVYRWFIARKSPVYDVDYKDGRCVLIRSEIKGLTLNKKTIVDTWSKDETEETC